MSFWGQVHGQVHIVFLVAGVSSHLSSCVLVFFPCIPGLAPHLLLLPPGLPCGGDSVPGQGAASHGSAAAGNACAAAAHQGAGLSMPLVSQEAAFWSVSHSHGSTAVQHVGPPPHAAVCTEKTPVLVMGQMQMGGGLCQVPLLGQHACHLSHGRQTAACFPGQLCQHTQLAPTSSACAPCSSPLWQSLKGPDN